MKILNRSIAAALLLAFFHSKFHSKAAEKASEEFTKQQREDVLQKMKSTAATGMIAYGLVESVYEYPDVKCNDPRFHNFWKWYERELRHIIWDVSM